MKKYGNRVALNGTDGHSKFCADLIIYSKDGTEHTQTQPE